VTIHPPTEISMSLDEVDASALIIDRDAFVRNFRHR
jgi:hypothetical protein